MARTADPSPRTGYVGMRAFATLASRMATLKFRMLTIPSFFQIAVAQSISGTGALRIATEFLAKYYPGPKSVYLPDPTWGNHIPLVEGTGMKVVRYRCVGSCVCTTLWSGGRNVQRRGRGEESAVRGGAERGWSRRRRARRRCRNRCQVQSAQGPSAEKSDRLALEHDAGGMHGRVVGRADISGTLTRRPSASTLPA